MKRAIGILLIILGVACTAWCAVVGGSFTGVYLLGYIGTDGNEAGRELAYMASFTVAGIVVGILITRLGMKLNASCKARR